MFWEEREGVIRARFQDKKTGPLGLCAWNESSSAAGQGRDALRPREGPRPYFPFSSESVVDMAQRALNMDVASKIKD